jgi:hypothetical protein
MSEAGTKNAMVIAAEAGDDKAQCELAMSYEHGIGCPKDYGIAAKWYEAAASSGNGFAAYKLALMYENGSLGGPNLKEAMVWLTRAAQSGLSEAQYKLGVMFDAGKSGGMENPKEAAQWFELAADQGVADAQWRLGVLYENGRGVKQDFDKAAKLYTAATAQGNLNAHYSLGVLHVTGEGVQQNPGEALRLFTIAADGGHAQAKRRLTAANIGKPMTAEEPEAELLTRNKKRVEEKAPEPEPIREFWINSLSQSLVLSLFFVVLVLTPVGDIINSVFKVIGIPLAILGGVGGIVALLSMAVFFKKRKEHVEDRWFKIACVVMVLIGIGVVIGVIGFSKYQFDDPEQHKNGAAPAGSTNAEQLLERAKKAGQQQ